MKERIKRGLGGLDVSGKEPWLNRLELGIVAGFLLAVGAGAADHRILFMAGIALSVSIVSCKIIRRGLGVKGE